MLVDWYVSNFQRPHQLIVDVTGPAADWSPDDVTDLLPADDVMFIHISDVRNVLRSLGSVESLSTVFPVVVYVNVSDAEPGQVMMELMPSVDSLETCRLGSTDHLITQMFAVVSSHRHSSVVLTRPEQVRRGRRYQLSIICQPALLHGTSASDQFTVYLHVHVI